MTQQSYKHEDDPQLDSTPDPGSSPEPKLRVSRQACATDITNHSPLRERKSRTPVHSRSRCATACAVAYMRAALAR